MEIKASSTYDKKTCTALVNAVYPNRKIYAILSSILSFALLICTIILIFKAQRSLAYFAALASIVPGVTAGMLIRLPSVQYSSMANSKNARCNYTFYDNELRGEISYSDGKILNTSTMKYEMIYKIVESNEYIFIFQSKKRTYVIEKSTVAKDELDNLKTLLKHHCPIKYTVLKK